MRKYKNKSLEYVLDNFADGTPYGLLRDGSDGGKKSYKSWNYYKP